jgi:hypothetical protein
MNGAAAAQLHNDYMWYMFGDVENEDYFSDLEIPNDTAYQQQTHTINGNQQKTTKQN